jgi:guanine nucleotide-binding protein alpha-1 subunit
MLSSDSNDPLTLAIAPPPDESPQQRADREKREREAQIVSDKIDEGIKKDRIALKKQKNVVRVLLLGQSESGKFLTSPTQLLILTIASGKSTTLKSLRLHQNKN